MENKLVFMQLTKEAKGFSNFSWRVLLYVRRTSILQQEQSVTGWAALIDTSHHSRWMYTWQALSFICIYQQKSARKPSKLTDESKGQNHEQSTPSSIIETRQKKTNQLPQAMQQIREIGQILDRFFQYSIKLYELRAKDRID